MTGLRQNKDGTWSIVTFSRCGCCTDWFDDDDAGFKRALEELKEFIDKQLWYIQEMEQ